MPLGSTNVVADAWIGEGESPGTIMAVSTSALRRVRFTRGPESMPTGTVTLAIVSGADRIRVWRDPAKGATNLLLSASSPSTNWVLAGASTWVAIPTNVWVEGVTNSASVGDVVLAARFTSPASAILCADTNVFTILKVDIKAEDGTSDPREYVDAGTDVAAAYSTVKYKVVVTPSISGSFTWSTTSSKITLTFTSSQTVTVNAGVNASSALDAEVLKVDFSPPGSTTICSDIHDLTVVHCTFTAYADNEGGLDPLVGHAWWQFGITPSDASDLIEPYYLRYYVNKQMGYYPVNMTIVVLPPWCSPGVLVIGPQGTHTPTAQHAWGIPFILLDNGLDYCSDIDDSPGTYHLWNYNCCHTTIGPAGSCGVLIPAENDMPTEMNDYLDGL